MKFKKKILPNGLTVIEVPSSDAESVVVDLFVKTGSRSETEKESGISHFLEHFLFKGTKKYPSSMAISQLVDGIGGEMNANTGKEHTQYYIKAASRHLPLIFEVLSDMLQNPLFDSVELEKEKGVIVEEINMYKDTPMYEIENVLERTMWPSDELGRDIAGTKETVTKFTREMFQDYINNHYQTSNLILGVSGKYDKHEFWKLVENFWAKFPKKEFSGWNKARDVQKEPRIQVQFKETEQAHLALGFKSFQYGDLRNPAIVVMSSILGGGMSSRLFDEIREKRGLAYYVRATPSYYQDTGLFGISAGLKIDKVEEAMRVILDELKKVMNEEIPEKELQKAKEYLKGRIVLALEDNQVRLDWFLERTAFYPTIDTPEDVFKKIDSVKASDISKVAKEIFQNNNMSLAIIGPYKSDKNFKKILKCS